MSREPIEDRIMFTMAWPGAMMERIDEYRYTNHIPSRAEAIRQLIDKALQTE